MKNLWLILLAIGGLYLWSRRGPKGPAPKVTASTGSASAQPYLSDLLKRIPVTNNANDHNSDAASITKSIADTLSAVFGGGNKKGGVGVSVGAGGGGGGAAPQKAKSSTPITSAPAGDGIGSGIPYDPGEQVTSTDLGGDYGYGDIFGDGGTYDPGEPVTSTDLPSAGNSWSGDYWTDYDWQGISDFEQDYYDSYALGY